ncbi:centrosomal protein of 95 kDa isoform X5 [Alligator mississippiensis]|uniref:centrosomal protein of 95 kDa isoform X5 n=1 Tax=Alligator mississippiensis TaxID=8496 RepID=UPI0009076037|nr:centrosomal protein of 95 kDa isoform X5 [Alligator mississippiensis]
MTFKVHLKSNWKMMLRNPCQYKNSHQLWAPSCGLTKQRFVQANLLCVLLRSSQSEISIPSWEVEGSESTSELIKLGDTACSLSLREEGFQLPELLPAETGVSKEAKEPESAHVALPSQPSTSRIALVRERKGSAESVHSTEFHKESLSSSAKKLGEPIRPAIPLQPPYQPSEPRPHYPIGREYQSPGRQSAALASSQTIKTPASAESCRQESETSSGNTSVSGITCDFPAGDKMVSEDDELNGDEGAAKDLGVYATSTSTSHLHHDISSCTQQTTSKALTPKPETKSLSDVERYESSTPDSLGEEPLFRRRAKGKLSEQELEEVSEKLSRRLNELDLMLKRALGERSREEELTDEDRLSQHSDSVMDYRRRILHPGTPCPKKNTRPRSLSPSPPPSRYLHPSAFEDALQRDARGQMGQMRRQFQKEQDYRRRKAKLMTKAYEDELRIYEARERLELSKLRAKAKEKEREYKENIFKEPPKMPRPVKVYSRKPTPQNPKHSQWIPRGGYAKPKKAAPMKVKDDDLLPLLLEEFPHLHISHHTLNKMWQQQLAQIERFKSSSGTERSRLKLQNEVEEALKKRDLLAEIIKKDQDHNKRLQEFKQRIHRQKWTQNKTREKRQQIARAKKYYEDYRVQLRARMMRARTREERIFKNLFEEGLEIQKQRLEELRAYAKEKRAEQKRVHQNELESMENYYKDQFSMLAEAVSREHQEIKTRERTQAKKLQKTKREVRSKVEKEIQQLQTMITQDDDDTFFRELEAERLKSRLQMASFQYSKNHFL